MRSESRRERNLFRLAARAVTGLLALALLLVASSVMAAEAPPVDYRSFFGGDSRLLVWEVYSASPVMGNNMMGGAFSWTFIIQAVLIGILFVGGNYYLWAGMGRIAGGEPLPVQARQGAHHQDRREPLQALVHLDELRAPPHRVGLLRNALRTCECGCAL